MLPPYGDQPRSAYLATVVASQLLSPLLWDHYAILLLLPVAWLLQQRQWWAAAVPLATSLPLLAVTPPATYPLLFFVALVAPVAIATVESGIGHMMVRFDRSAAIGWGAVGVAAIVYWLAARDFDAGRGDFFYLADAFLHGRTWLDFRPGPNDVIIVGGRFYVPFAPFPAIALMPVVAVARRGRRGPGRVRDQRAPGGRRGWAVLDAARTDRRPAGWSIACADRPVRVLDPDPVGHDPRRGLAHRPLIATILTFLCLIELSGRRRAWLIGLLAGAAFLTRAPLAFAVPFYALLLVDWRRWRVAATSARPSVAARGSLLALGVLPSIVVFFVYNQVRFGTPFESGYGLATLPGFLEVQREQGPVLAGPRPDEPGLLPASTCRS